MRKGGNAMNEKNAPFQKVVIIRTVVLLIAWLNQYLAFKGISPLPFTDEEMGVGVSLVITFVISMWSWWKNNDITRRARTRTEYLKNKGLY